MLNEKKSDIFLSSNGSKTSGYSASGKVRGKYFLLESQGISIFFVASQGKLA